MSTAPIEKVDQLEQLDFTIQCEIKAGTIRNWLFGGGETIYCDKPADYQADVHYVIDCSNGTQYVCEDHLKQWEFDRCPACDAPIMRNATKI